MCALYSPSRYSHLCVQWSSYDERKDSISLIMWASTCVATIWEPVSKTPNTKLTTTTIPILSGTHGNVHTYGHRCRCEVHFAASIQYSMTPFSRTDNRIIWLIDLHVHFSCHQSLPKTEHFPIYLLWATIIPLPCIPINIAERTDRFKHPTHGPDASEKKMWANLMKLRIIWKRRGRKK